MVAQDPANQRSRQSSRTGQIRGESRNRGWNLGETGGRGRAERAGVREMGGCSVVSRVTGLPQPSRPPSAIPVYPRNNCGCARRMRMIPAMHSLIEAARTNSGGKLGHNPLDFPPRGELDNWELDSIPLPASQTLKAAECIVVFLSPRLARRESAGKKLQDMQVMWDDSIGGWRAPAAAEKANSGA